MTKRLCSYSEFSVGFFFNRMGNLFYCEDDFYFRIYIHISKKKIVISCTLNYFHSCYFHHWVRYGVALNGLLSSWLDKFNG